TSYQCNLLSPLLRNRLRFFRTALSPATVSVSQQAIPSPSDPQPPSISTLSCGPPYTSDAVSP
ncbi:hypothetical protein AYI68_g3310, partial [Smittium mucronatum]